MLWDLRESHLQQLMRDVGDKRIGASLQRRVHHRRGVASPNMHGLPSGMRDGRRRS